MPKPNVFKPGRNAMNRGTATNPSNESPRKPAPSSLAVGFLLVFSLGLTACPVDAAWGRASVGSSHPSQRFEEPAPVAPTGSFGTTSTEDYTFHDDASGATLSHFSQESSDSASESEDFVPPNIEAIELQSGEECLHEEGTCAGCDTLRGMYRSGKIDALYCATIVTGTDTSDQFVLSVPADADVTSYIQYSCKDGEPAFGPRRSDGLDDDPPSIQIKGNLHALQSPFGISYSTSESESERTDSITVHAYTPDDDYDSDEEDTWIDNLLKVIGLVVIIFGIGLLIGSIRLKIEKWLK